MVLWRQKLNQPIKWSKKLSLKDNIVYMSDWYNPLKLTAVRVDLTGFA